MQQRQLQKCLDIVFICCQNKKMIELDTPTEQEAKLMQYLDDYLVEIHKKKPDFSVKIAWLQWFHLFWIHESIIISKQFKFIERLIQTDKIDYDKTFEWNAMAWTWWNYAISVSAFTSKTREEIQIDKILMILSVNERPLHFLQSILK